MMNSDHALSSICDAIERVWPCNRWSSLAVVVGVSGGADSVCLLRAMEQLARGASGTLIVAHYDHRTRPDSARDANFVKALAARLRLNFELGCSPTEGAGRSESELRDERYDFLESTACRLGARYVVVAHTQDDHVETILHNILRGTGGSGAAGISAFRDLGQDLVLARPMLDVTRQQIESTLKACQQSFRVDLSNTESNYTRNWLRNQLLPNLREKFPQVDKSLLHLASNVAQLQDSSEFYAKRLEAAAVSISALEARISVAPLAQTPDAVVVTMLQRVFAMQCWPRGGMTRTHWNHLLEAIRSPAASGFQLPGAIDVRREHEIVILRRS